MLYLAGLFAVAAVVAGLLAFRAFQSQAALKLKAGPLENAVPGGMVHVMGRVVPLDELLSSPKLGRECVYYRYVEQVYREPSRHHHHASVGVGGGASVSFSVGGSSGVEGLLGAAGALSDANWSVVKSEEDRVDFAIEDGSGLVKIECAGAKFILVRDHEASSRGRDEHDFEEGGTRRTQRREMESFVEPGDLVRVIGHARGSAPRRDTDNPAMVIGKAGSPVFVVTDKPKGEVIEGFSGRLMTWGFAAALLAVAAVICVGIANMPTPEQDPIVPDTRLKPIERVRRPSAD